MRFRKLKEKDYPTICRVNDSFVKLYGYSAEEKKRYIDKLKKFITQYHLVAIATSCGLKYFSILNETLHTMFGDDYEDGVGHIDHELVFKQANGKLLLASFPYGDKEDIIEDGTGAFVKKYEDLRLEFCDDLKFIRNGDLMFAIYKV